jgi:hypothetical protein
MYKKNKSISPVFYIFAEEHNLISMLNSRDVFIPDTVVKFPHEAAFCFVQPTECWAALFIKTGKQKTKVEGQQQEWPEKDAWMAARAETFRFQYSGVWQKNGWLIYHSVPYEVDQLQMKLAELGITILPFLPAFTTENEDIKGRPRVEMPHDVPLFQNHVWAHAKDGRPCPWW